MAGGQSRQAAGRVQQGHRVRTPPPQQEHHQYQSTVTTGTVSNSADKVQNYTSEPLPTPHLEIMLVVLLTFFSSFFSSFVPRYLDSRPKREGARGGVKEQSKLQKDKNGSLCLGKSGFLSTDQEVYIAQSGPQK